MARKILASGLTAQEEALCRAESLSWRQDQGIAFANSASFGFPSEKGLMSIRQDVGLEPGAFPEFDVSGPTHGDDYRPGGPSM